MVKRLAMVLALTVSGCISTAGPYVTNLTPGPRGTINVEKCTVKYSSLFGGSVEKGDCATTVIAPNAEASK